MSESVLREALADRYKIERELGRGGMATVYLADDLRYHRPVAVKVLHPHLGAALGVERFLREIQVVARLRHPHIVPLFDSGEAGGLLFYVMPYIKGETLRERLARVGSFPTTEALRIICDITDALDYAHGEGVIHRDVKPENVILDERHAMITDFGIARALSESAGPALTETGLLVGTPAYMSPEQVSGEKEIDGRSDVYSVGCLLYEMLAGQPVFTAGSTNALMAKRFSISSPNMAPIANNSSDEIRGIITKSMQLEPKDRFRNAREMRSALENVGSGSHSGKGKRLAGLAVAAAIAVAAAVFIFNAKSGETPAADQLQVATIGVLPFVNRSGDKAMEYFSDGLTDELISALSRVKGLQVAGRATSFSIKGKNLDAREAASRLQVAYIVDAGVRSGGNRVRVTWQLIDGRTGRGVGSGDIDGQMSDVLALQDSLARKIVEDLRPAFSGITGATVKRQQTGNYEAHDLYLKGHFYWNQRTAGSMRQGISYLKQAIAKDPGYALAWAELASALTLEPAFGDMPKREVEQEAREAAKKAVALDPTLAEAYTALGISTMFNDWNFPLALSYLDRAIALDPNNSFPRLFRTWPLVAMGRVEEGLEQVKMARKLDPLSPIINTRVGTLLGFLGRTEEAVVELRKALAIDPTNVIARFELGKSLTILGRHEEAFKEFPDAIDVEAGYAAGRTAWAYGKAGKRDEARAIYRRLQARSKQRYIVAEGMAMAAEGSGDRRAALDWIDKAFQERSFYLPVVSQEPSFAELREEPRVQAVLKAVRNWADSAGKR